MTTNRRWLVASAVGLAVLCATFLAGRATAPVPAVKDERKVEASSQSSVKSASTAHVEAIAHVEAKADTDAKTHTVTRWLPAVPAANGCPAVPAHVEQETTTETHAATSRTADKTREARTQATRDVAHEAKSLTVETHTSTPVRPVWSFGISGGVAREHAVPILGPVIIGGQLGHRIAGPFSLDLSGNTSPAVLLTLRIDL